MHSKTRLGSMASILGTFFAVLILIGLFSGNVLANGYDLCGDNEDFTADFLIEDSQFKKTGFNPYQLQGGIPK